MINDSQVIWNIQSIIMMTESQAIYYKLHCNKHWHMHSVVTNQQVQYAFQKQHLRNEQVSTCLQARSLTLTTYTLTTTSTGSVDGTLANSGLGSGDPSSGRGYIFTVPLKYPTAPTSSGSRDPLPRLRGKVWARSVNL